MQGSTVGNIPCLRASELSNTTSASDNNNSDASNDPPGETDITQIQPQMMANQYFDSNNDAITCTDQQLEQDPILNEQFHSKVSKTLTSRGTNNVPGNWVTASL